MHRTVSTRQTNMHCTISTLETNIHRTVSTRRRFRFFRSMVVLTELITPDPVAQERHVSNKNVILVTTLQGAHALKVRV